MLLNLAGNSGKRVPGRFRTIDMNPPFDAAKAIVGLRPSFSAQVRWGEPGAPVWFPPGLLRHRLPRRSLLRTHYSESHVRRSITGRLEFLGLSFLGHGGIARDCFALSQGLAQNSAHPAVDLSSLARMVLRRRPGFPVDRRCLAPRHSGRPAAGRPYDTTSDTDVGGTTAAAAGSAGCSASVDRSLVR